MPDAIKIPDKISAPERFLAGFVLFFSAVLFCLPVPPSEEVATLYPWWGQRIAIGNVQLHELIFVVWFALYGRRFVPRALFNGGIPTRQAAIWLIVLALWCGLMSLTTPLPLLDVGRTFRLLLNVVLMFAIVRWTRQTGEFPLGMLILGFLIGTVINFVLSFQYPLIVYETMRLSGQNTPGVAMGIAIHLSAWLFFRASHHKLQAFAVFTALVFVFGCAMSYSRIGWFAGGLGLIAWVYVLVAARPRERSERLRLKKARWVWFPLLVLGLVALLNLPLAQENLQRIQTLVEQKFGSDSVAKMSNVQRTSYLEGVSEILMKHPLGVGYSGFFDAMTATEIYRSGRAATEWDYTANPHSGFLYYASAGGIPGGVMVIAVFVMLLNAMRFGLASAMGRPGLVLFVLVALPFLVIGLTVPYIFNSVIVIAPAAIAAGWGWTQRVRGRMAGRNPDATSTDSAFRSRKGSGVESC